MIVMDSLKGIRVGELSFQRYENLKLLFKLFDINNLNKVIDRKNTEYTRIEKQMALNELLGRWRQLIDETHS